MLIASLSSRVSAAGPALTTSDTIAPVPYRRWDVETHAETARGPHARFGGFMDHIELLDAHYYGMQPSEAATTDPQQRQLLICMAEAMSPRPPGRLSVGGNTLTNKNCRIVSSINTQASIVHLLTHPLIYVHHS